MTERIPPDFKPSTNLLHQGRPPTMTSLTRPHRNLSRLGTTLRRIHATPARRAADRQPGAHPNITQGHTTSPENSQRGSAQPQSVESGFDARASETHPQDAAASGSVRKEPRGVGISGNPEGVGFADQVGGQSARKGGGSTEGRTEDAAAPSFLGKIKQALGIGTSVGEVKQNRGAGGGVTGTGTFQFQTLKKPPGERQRRGLSTSLQSARETGRNKEMEGRKAGASEGQHTRYQQENIPVTERSEFEEGRLERQMHTPGTDVNAGAPSGCYHNSGMPGDGNSREYGHVCRKDPYDLPGAERDLKLRYGGKKWKVNTLEEDQQDDESDGRGRTT